MPVYQDAVVFLALAIALAFTLVLVGARVFFSRRALQRRLGALVTRMTNDPDPGRGVEGALARLERAADDSVFGSNAPDADGERFRLALGELPVGLVICDEHGKVVYRNPAAARQVWPKVEGGVAGRADPALAAGLSAVLSEALGGTRVSKSVTVSEPAPQILRLTGVPLDDGLRPAGAVVVVEDVSEEQRHSGTRRDLYADLSAQLVEPLVGVGLLADQLSAEEDPLVRGRLAERARAEAARTRRLVESLLDLGRAAAQEPRQTERVAVAPVATEAIARLSSEAQKRLVSVRLVSAAPDAEVVARRDQVERAVGKLLEYAIESARTGAKLELRARRRVEPAGDAAVEVEVTEPGSSMAGPRPAGLTFAIVEQAARNLGGSVSTATIAGVGTTATLRLAAAGTNGGGALRPLPPDAPEG